MSVADEMPTRKFAALTHQTFDLLIIGGGIVGAGVARDAALRGLSVALVERGDFASGTSSKTSKLIHGGLRYLEHAQFRLVGEASRERRLLLQLAPHLVHPQEFLLPVYRDDPRGRFLIHLGLALYDLLAGFRNMRLHRCLTRPLVVELEPTLRADGLQGGAIFGDAQMRDARLVLENVLDACERGAVCINYATVRELLQTDGRLSGAIIEDHWTKERVTVRARVIVNATGPSSDTVRRLSDATAASRLRLSRGVHLVVRSLGLKRALLLMVPEDRRIVFVQPWGEQTLIGTTETAHHAGDTAQVTPEDIAYLLRVVNRIVGTQPLTRSDVIATFAGVRPLVDTRAKTLTSASREHALEVDRHGLISLLGGKFTTYRALAALVVDRVCQALGRRQRSRTANEPLYGGVVPDPTSYATTHGREAIQRGLAMASAEHLVRTYGVRSRILFDWIAKDSQLLPTVCPHHPHLAAEVRYAFEEELAQTLSDFYFRRTWIAYSPCHGREALPRIEAVLRAHVPTMAQRFPQDVRTYEEEIAAMQACRATGATHA